MEYQIYRGDVIEVLKDIPDETYTCVLTDPPYGLSFMGKQWDHGVPSTAVWAEVLRVCKPGAVMLAFGGTRTFHRLAVNIEDAGWEIADMVNYLHSPDYDQWAAENYGGWCECDDSTP